MFLSPSTKFLCQVQVRSCEVGSLNPTGLVLCIFYECFTKPSTVIRLHDTKYVQMPGIEHIIRFERLCVKFAYRWHKLNLCLSTDSKEREREKGILWERGSPVPSTTFAMIRVWMPETGSIPPPVVLHFKNHQTFSCHLSHRWLSIQTLRIQKILVGTKARRPQCHRFLLQQPIYGLRLQWGWLSHWRATAVDSDPNFLPSKCW